MWTHFICDTTTGAKRLQVEPSAGSFAALVSDIGGGEHSFQVRESGIDAATWRDVTYPWKNTVVQCWNGVPRYAGLVVGSTLDRGAGTLTVQHKELRLLLNRRFPFRIGGERTPDGALTVSGRSLRGLLVEVVRAGVYKPDDVGGWNLPVTLPPSEAGGYGATFHNYDFVTIENAIDEIESREGGPDVVFEPRFVDDRLDWLLRIGAPRLSGPVYDFPMNVPEPMLTDASPTDDGSAMLTGVFAIGKGSEADMRVGEAGDRGLRVPGTPFLDSSRAFKEIDDVGLLTSHGYAELDAHARPTTQWDAGYRLDQAYGDGPLRLGSTVRMRYARDWWEGTRDVDQYLIGVRGDLTPAVRFDLQPFGSL